MGRRERASVLSKGELRRVFHTVRYLEPIQVVDRVRRRVLPLRSIPRVGGSYALAARAAMPPTVPHDGGFDGRSFRFLNRRLPFGGRARWEPAGAERLWAYQWHYFRFLAGVPDGEGLLLILDWSAATRIPCRCGSVSGPSGW